MAHNEELWKVRKGSGRSTMLDAIAICQKLCSNSQAHEADQAGAKFIIITGAHIVCKCHYGLKIRSAKFQ